MELLSAAGFSGARFGALSDLTTKDWRAAFEILREFSDRYLTAASEAGVWPGDYPWPRDALHANTRVWEYPYVWHSLQRHAPRGGQVLDIGSALTFMPSFMAQHGYRVLASDIDPRMEHWFGRLSAALAGHSWWPTERLAYGLKDVTNLELPPDSLDVVTNISVLEHLPMELVAQAVKSIHRALRPGGIFVCTLDCWLKGPRTKEHWPLDAQEFARFLETLQLGFCPVESFAARVPSDLITNRVFPLAAQCRLTPPAITHLDAAPAGGLNHWFRGIAKAVLRRPPAVRLEWCVFGLTLQKHSTAT